MPWLLDTNLIIDLSQHNLCSEFLKTFHIDTSDLMILREMDHKLENNKDYTGKKLLAEKKRKNCQKFCDGLKRISEPFSDELERNALLTKHPEIRVNGLSVTIDPGEAQLFAITRTLADFKICTADKRSLLALSVWPGCEQVHKRMQGKVYCLERIMLELIREHGFDKISKRIVNGKHSIEKAKAAGASGCCDVLIRAASELQSNCKGLLAA